MRINQEFLDAAGAWRAARCVSTAFNPARWNPLVTNWSGFGVYRIQFEDTFTSYCTPLMKMPVAGLGALVDGCRWPRAGLSDIVAAQESSRPCQAPRFRNTCTDFGVRTTTFRDCTDEIHG